MSDSDFTEMMARMAPVHAAEKRAVRTLGDAIGYGRMMQLAEEIWREIAIADNIPGSEHTTGPCATFMVRCPHPEVSEEHIHCEWCCGSGRVTKRVREAMSALPSAPREP